MKRYFTLCYLTNARSNEIIEKDVFNHTMMNVANDGEKKIFEMFCEHRGKNFTNGFSIFKVAHFFIY